ncbi:hypothetical protein Rsub_09295 [Raphidocelis subcapitata]|uniref:J domain-containing protein n=1 Tax=Raphidocelis subcapitata TaxID=307507 RepID=A0A2V0PCJ1_9CHLO|nr:hypothetical protein Rsub_09295 [Raphidocelis subcapitata]|eukprot:GBF96662.1 hypothetical protein Rsub_09295 [Raphidocelis subcapitata]
MADAAPGAHGAAAPPPLPPSPAPPQPPQPAPPLPQDGAPPPLPPLPQDSAQPPPLPGDAPPLPPWHASGAGEAAPAPKQEPDAASAAGPSSDAAAADDGAEAGPSSSARPLDESVFKEFFAEVREVDRDNEANRILWAFKLNPFEKLNLRFDATPEEIRRQYRKLSLLVHPDKCSHPQAAAAFDVLGAAQKELLDEVRMEAFMAVINRARDEVRAERRKETKNDAAIALAATLHERGREGVEEEWERTDAFHERWKLKARDMLARGEWRKRKLTKRLKEEEERAGEEHKEAVAHARKQRDHHKAWESNRESRVTNWRDYQKGPKGKAKAPAQLKPPKQKTHDEDKLYVQRPVGEQFRPPAPKPAGH